MGITKSILNKIYNSEKTESLKSAYDLIIVIDSSILILSFVFTDGCLA